MSRPFGFCPCHVAIVALFLHYANCSLACNSIPRTFPKPMAMMMTMTIDRSIDIQTVIAATMRDVEGPIELN